MRETKTGGMLGCKRRFQFRMAIFGLFILAMFMTMGVAGAMETGSLAPLAITAIAPVAATDLTIFAKKSEDMTPEEKATVGTIQKSMIDLLNATLKGVLTEDDIQKRLDGIQNDILEKQKQAIEEGTQALQTKYDESLELINKLRTDINSLNTELKEAKEKLDKKSEDVLKDAITKAVESDSFKAFADGHSKMSDRFDIPVRKGVVSMTSNYSGTTYPSLQTDVITAEVALRKLHIRDFMRVVDGTQIEATSIYFRQVYEIDRAALAVSENGQLPEGSFKMKEAAAETHRIGYNIPISRRMLRKVSYIVNEIMSLMPSGLYRAEDFQILYGDGHDANFTGLVKIALTESALSSTVYSEQTAGKVKSIASYDNGNAILVTLNGAYAKMNTGMKVVFSGFQTCTALNAAAGFEIKVVNDHTFFVACSYTAETDSSVQNNAKFTITNTYANLVADANYGDALKVIAGFLNFDKYRPTLIVINPITFNAFKGLKDKTGRPIWREYFTVVNGVYYLDGVIPVVECDAIAKGKVFMGDFDEGAALYDMDGGTLEFAEDVQTKLTNTAVAILQEDVAMPVYCPDAFMYADLDTVVSAITKAGDALNVAITSPLNDDQDALMMQAKA